MRLVLPWPPSANALYRTIVKGKRAFPIKSSEYRNFETRVREIMLTQRHQPFARHVLLSMRIWAYRPRKLGDLDNVIKATDILHGIAFEDDAQIVEIHAYRLDDKERPRLVVEIEPASCAVEMELPL